MRHHDTPGQRNRDAVLADAVAREHAAHPRYGYRLLAALLRRGPFAFAPQLASDWRVRQAMRGFRQRVD
jgi:hypothetical protein